MRVGTHLLHAGAAGRRKSQGLRVDLLGSRCRKSLKGVIVMNETAPRRRSKFRLFGLFGFWTRYRAKQDEKMIEAMSNPDERHDIQAARAERLSGEREAMIDVMTHEHPMI